jgi:hypothetical protein
MQGEEPSDQGLGKAKSRGGVGSGKSKTRRPDNQEAESMFSHSKRIVLVIAAFGLVASLAGTASAAPLRPWGGGLDSGSATFISWTGGGDDAGLFGDPLIIPAGGPGEYDTFVFFPAGFRAENAGTGSSVTTTDRIEVTITANLGYNVTSIVVSEYGDYAITGPGGSVDLQGTLSASEVGGLGRFYSDSVDPALGFPSFPITSGSGDFQADASIDLSGDVPGWTSFTFELENDLIAFAAAGSTASIEKKLVGQGVAVQFIPEPATLALLGMGALVAVRRRRA